MVHMISRLFVVTMLLSPPFGALRAQVAHSEVRVNVIRELNFGNETAGAPLSGAPSDTGVFEILGAAGDEVDVVFALPNAMESPTGSRLPLTFDVTSGAYSAAQSGADHLLFDPRLRQRFRIPASGRFFLYIAPRATPPRTQGTGHYRANVIIYVSPTP